MDWCTYSQVSMDLDAIREERLRLERVQNTIVRRHQEELPACPDTVAGGDRPLPRLRSGRALPRGLLMDRLEHGG